MLSLCSAFTLTTNADQCSIIGDDAFFETTGIDTVWCPARVFQITEIAHRNNRKENMKI